MAELRLAVIALAPPLREFAQSTVRMVKSFIRAERLIENRGTLKCLQREIESWISSMVAINESHVFIDTEGQELFSACKETLSTYKSKLGEIRRKIEGYDHSSNGWDTVVRQVLELSQQLEELELDVTINSWLAALETYTSSRSLENQQNNLNRIENQVSVLLESEWGRPISDQTSLNNHSHHIIQRIDELLEVERVLCTRGDHLVNFKLALKGLWPEYDGLPEAVGASATTSSGRDWDSDATRADTIDTTLNDEIHTNDQDPPATMRHPEYADKSCQTAKLITTEAPDKQCVTKIPDKAEVNNREVREKLETEEDSSQSHSVLAKEMELTQGGFPLVAGSIEKDEVSEVPVLKVLEEDWNQGREFDFDTVVVGSQSQSVITLHIALPQKLLVTDDSLSKESAPSEGTGPAFRTFSLVLLPLNRRKEGHPDLHSVLSSTTTPKSQVVKQALHWNLREATASEDLRGRISRLEALHQRGIQHQGGNRLRGTINIAVFITIPWIKYREWSQRDSENTCFDALSAEGILATLPMLIERHEPMMFGCLEPRIWCENKIQLRRYNTVKTVHAIIQEFNHSGSFAWEGRTPGVTYPTKFVVVIFQTGGAQGWLRLARSVYAPKLEETFSQDD